MANNPYNLPTSGNYTITTIQNGTRVPIGWQDGSFYYDLRRNGNYVWMRATMDVSAPQGGYDDALMSLSILDRPNGQQAGGQLGNCDTIFGGPTSYCTGYISLTGSGQVVVVGGSSKVENLGWSHEVQIDRDLGPDGSGVSYVVA